MKTLYKITLPFLLLLLLCAAARPQSPALRKTPNSTELLVNGKPFLILGAELGNSTATTPESMREVWPKLTAMHLNTVLVPVYWELVEPEEGKFDFSLYSQLIGQARQNDLKLVFLWFASWKNSMSTHVPAYIKTDPLTYPRARDEQGIAQEILTPFSENNLLADLCAFEKLMQFLKEYDSEAQTVIMVQVENETAMLPVPRDHSAPADSAYASEIPRGLIRYMVDNRDRLTPELSKAWKDQGYLTSGSWEAVLGKSSFTEEAFMAWYFSLYTNRIAEAGKKIYPIPMYVNAALNRPWALPGSGYPAGGPLPHLLDVWKAAGKSVDIISPDIYFSGFAHWCDLYTRLGDPLFIPEIRFDNTVAAKAFYTFGHYEALGFSPFSAETAGKEDAENLSRAYEVLTQLQPLLISSRGQQLTDGILLDKADPDTVISLGNYVFSFRHDLTLGWSPGAKEETWPAAGALIIQASDNSFWFAGTGFVVTVTSATDPGLRVGILKAEEGRFESGNWKVIRYLNGDQTHQGRHIRIPAGEYGVQKVEFYTYR